MDADIKRIVSQMTLEEKAGLCSGADVWHTKSVKRLNIPSVMMADGPHGLRKQAGEDELGLSKSVEATCFPTAAALACSWDRDLLKRVGAAIGEECRKRGVSILLGPGCNIKRSPLCGRNFEYFSEDPYLSSEMACAHIRGVQSRGVGASLKHFAVNNQETRRMNIDAIVDECTLREIYLRAFETAVKDASPRTVMCSYNKVNGEYCSENAYLLTGILRNEWGYNGCVVSDWGAVNDRVKGLVAGLDIEMPSSNGERDKLIAEAVKSGRLPERVLDKTVERILALILQSMSGTGTDASADMDAHHLLAREAARESIVLLKNDDDMLPFKKQGTLAVIGGFAGRPRYQGAGSSHVNPYRLDSPYEEIRKAVSGQAEITYAQGYRMDELNGSVIKHELESSGDVPDAALIDEAVSIARGADAAVIFAGLPESYESEGVDRKHLRMPEGHCALIEAVAGAQKNVVVVLSNGAPIEMPWLDKVGAVLEAYLGGQAFGGAIADVLFGDADPCGKLAETFPARLSDNPSYLNFPGEKQRVEYREGLFVGYRYYDAKQMKPLFPFGYGLSYTEFEYTGMSINSGSPRSRETSWGGNKRAITDADTLTVRVSIKNTGSVFGKEVVQLYVRDVDKQVVRPDKELKAFAKVSLNPGEEKEAVFKLDRRAFAYYDTEISGWNVHAGAYDILIGKSSADIVFSERVSVAAKNAANRTAFTQDSTMEEILADSDRVEEIEAYFTGLLESLGCSRLKDIPVLFRDMPLRSMLVFVPEGFSHSTLESILETLNE